jgi:hypothetical protein
MTTRSNRKLHLVDVEQRQRARRHGIRTVVLLGVGLAAGFALGWSAKAAEFHVVAHGISHHSGERVETQTTLVEYDQCIRAPHYRLECSKIIEPVTREVMVPYNEQNWGAALRAVLTPSWAVQGGAYRNSYDRTSVYALADFTPLRAGVFSAGLFGAVASGYEHGAFGGGLIARLQGERLGAAIRFMPDVTEKQSVSTTSLEVTWRL